MNNKSIDENISNVEDAIQIPHDVISIVLCYNNAQEVKSYVKQFFLLDNSDKAFVVIVINAANDQDISILRDLQAKYEQIMIVDPHQNLGYMNGLIYGYRLFSRKYAEVPAYVIMSNTDIEYNSQDFLTRLLDRTYPADTWCIGPSIYTKYTKNYDNPVADKRRSKKEINSLIIRFSLPVFAPLYVYLAGVKAKLRTEKKTASREVYEVHGCYFILTGECAETIKNDKFGALMYSEETYIAEQVYQHGKHEYYDAELEIIHIEHTATKLLGAKKISSHLRNSMKYIRDRFYN